MKIRRTIPPAAAPIGVKSLMHGLVGMLFGRRYLEKLERELRTYFGVKHVFLVSSGKAALTLILQALRSLQPNRREVVIPAYTCFSVPSAIVKADLKVLLCDIGPSNFDFDYELLANTIQGGTLCVIPNHLFGMPADMDKIYRLCKDKGVFIVEDAAQAMGGSYKDRKLGTIGDAGFFSLGRGKNLTSGSGGIIVTNSDVIARAIEERYALLENPHIGESLMEFLKTALMTLFILPSLYWFPAGLPFLRLGETMFYEEFPIKRLCGMKAGLLKGWQMRLEESNRIRKANSEYFHERLRPAIRLDQSNVTADPIYFLRFPLLLQNQETRDRIYLGSHKGCLGLSKMYPSPVNEIEAIRHQFNGKMYPAARRMSETLLTIPTHQLLSGEDRERVSDLLKQIAH